MNNHNKIKNSAQCPQDTYFYHRFPYIYRLPAQRSIIVNKTIITGDFPYGVTVKTKTRIPTKEALHIFFETTAIIALYLKQGGLRRSVGAIGGYHEGVESGKIIQPKLNVDLKQVLSQLQKCNNPFQIQCAFTLSKAYAIEDIELRILEFFKIIEIATKYYASRKIFSTQVYNQIFNQGKLFTPEVKTAWANLLQEETIDFVWGLKDIRNKTVGHGGIRPDVSMFIKDPESNYLKLKKFFIKFNDFIPSEERYYEVLDVDIELVARLLFCKICSIEPFYFKLPGWWFIPSSRVLQILSQEGMSEIPLSYDDFDLFNRFFA